MLPFKNAESRVHPKCWLSNDIIKLIHERDHIHRLAIKKSVRNNMEKL